MFKNQSKYTLKDKENEENDDNENFLEIGKEIEVNNWRQHTMDDLEENIMLHAAVHVTQARSQQLLANEKIEVAKFNVDETNNVNHDSKIQTIIMDYFRIMLTYPILEEINLEMHAFSLGYLSTALVFALLLQVT